MILWLPAKKRGGFSGFRGQNLGPAQDGRTAIGIDARENTGCQAQEGYGVFAGPFSHFQAESEEAPLSLPPLTREEFAGRCP